MKELKAEDKPKTKFQRWKHAVKHMSPYRMAVNRYYASLGNVIGLFLGMCFLVVISIVNKTINYVWLGFFLPFIFILQVLNLIGAWQHLDQMKKIKDLIHKQGKGGNEDESKS